MQWLVLSSSSPGGVRMMFSVNEAHLVTKPAVLGLVLDEMANLLNIAGINESMAIEILSGLRQTNDSLLSAMTPVKVPPTE